VFGSLISAVLLAVPPLWHAAREVIDPSTIDPTFAQLRFASEQAIEPAIGKSLEINTTEQDIQENREADNRKAKQPGCAGHLCYLPKSLSADSRKERVKRYFVTGERAEGKDEAGNKAPNQYR
jgi:hypothetical protein